ncbi:gluconokinase (plasmid) [Azospirillum sp. TSH58]|uniref:gluconokinase n=1 Tax=Azospirillum sp. TSH58 TaxID=664962 RepID=UPI000D603008|nr:gluconokinase [Azospirillum sp. TSH58]AWJ87362.1 gluconokinase [Azospirillum sp. TSH58]PWC65012.1 gluconokinase [Azospirillum sp. TSH58]
MSALSSPDVTANTGGPVDAVVVMGVAGCGKTSVGKELARRLGWQFLEGDGFHPPENIAKMSAGIPLQDEDRWGWLDTIAAHIALARDANAPIVVSCSALKRRYRERLSTGGTRVLFVHLDGDRDTIHARMALRSGHFMPTALLDSQFAALEPLGSGEFGIVCNIDASPTEIAARVAALVAPAA